ncbi:MAG TPA: Ig-like domain-containing protein [Vulgatibacter sp.]|nr:Ig-like domain-containing protein [Vulgatibacter sp.]
MKWSIRLAAVAALALAACGVEEGPYEKEVSGPLALVSSLPPDGATDFDRERSIELEFSRPVNPDTLAIVLIGAPDPAIDVQGEMVEVKAPLDFETDYVLRVDRAEDVFGNALAGAPIEIRFRTAADGTVILSTIADVQPIFNRSCVDGCHVGRRPSGGLSLVSGLAWSQLVDVRGSTCAPGVRMRVVPGEPDESCLWLLVERGEMPERGTISAADKEAIRKWIADGALP